MNLTGCSTACDVEGRLTEESPLYHQIRNPESTSSRLSSLVAPLTSSINGTRSVWGRGGCSRWSCCSGCSCCGRIILRPCIGLVRSSRRVFHLERVLKMEFKNIFFFFQKHQFVIAKCVQGHSIDTKTKQHSNTIF